MFDSQQCNSDIKPTRIIGVLIAIGPRIVREAIWLLIDRQPDMVVVGSAATCTQCCRMAYELAPDVLVCDLDTQDGCQAESMSTLRRQEPELPAIVLHHRIRDQRVEGASRLGVQGYLTMDADPESLFEAIRVVSGGGTYLDQNLQLRLLDIVGGAPRTQLSLREQQVLAMVAEGKSNQQIAEILFMSKSTVKHYMSGLLSKLEASNRAQAVAVAKELGLL